MSNSTYYSNATEIIPGLWLGDFTSSSNISFIKNKQIQCLINCTNNNQFIDDQSIEIKYTLPIYEQINHEDEQDLAYLLFLSLHELSTKIQSFMDEYNCLIFDEGDQHIALCCIMAYFVKYTDMNPKQIITALQSKRPNCFNNNFIYQSLIDLYWENLHQEIKPNLPT
jgi:hypothetical protein